MPENNPPGSPPPHRRIPPPEQRNCPPAPSKQGKRNLPIGDNCRRRIYFGWDNPPVEPNIPNIENLRI